MKAMMMTLMMVAGLFVGTAAAQDDHVALVKNVSGQVQVVRAGEALPATPGLHLLRSDKVVSGQDSTAGIVFVDGTRITVGASTEIEVSQYMFDPKQSKYGFSLYVKKGSAIYSSGRLGKLAPDAVNLKTPRATVGIRGTRFVVTVD